MPRGGPANTHFSIIYCQQCGRWCTIAVTTFARTNRFIPSYCPKHAFYPDQEVWWRIKEQVTWKPASKFGG